MLPYNFHLNSGRGHSRVNELRVGKCEFIFFHLKTSLWRESIFSSIHVTCLCVCCKPREEKVGKQTFCELGSIL